MKFQSRLTALLICFGLLMSTTVFASEIPSDEVWKETEILASEALPSETASTEPVETEPGTTEPQVTEPETKEAAEPTEPSEPEEPTESEEPTPQPREDEEHQAYIAGCGDGSFLPLASLTRAELSQIMWRLGDYPEGETRFSDVPSTAWYAQAVNALAAAEILKGYPDGGFHPGDTTTRAMLVTVLQRLSGLRSENECDFPDVVPGYWASESIALAQEQGWVTGFPDGTFGPNLPVTRAEAVTMINRYLGRTPDVEAIAAGQGLRFFPDVQPDAWYYEAVMEAATSHTAHYESANPSEHWQNPHAASAGLADGYYCINGKLYVALGGDFLHQAASGQLMGLDYSCAGASGVCTVDTEILTTVDGALWHLTNGSVNPTAGLYELTNGLYCANEGGSLLRNGDYHGLHFGGDGRYTSSNASIDSYIEGILNSETNASMTREQKLFACYCHVVLHSAKYLSNNNHVPRGQNCRLWSEEYMLRLINVGRGNCYCFASEFYYLARRLGYWDSRAVSGGVYSKNTDHGWVEITIDGTLYVFDARAEYSNYTKAGADPGVLYMRTYIEMPWVYHFT